MDLQRLEELAKKVDPRLFEGKEYDMSPDDIEFIAVLIYSFPTILKQLRAGEALAQAVENLSVTTQDISLSTILRDVTKQRDVALARYNESIK